MFRCDGCRADDTDRLYDRLIRPTLTRAGIHSVFMGRLEHNDDIDKRIIREIEQAHFVIADLTYARPSVYFEAGFAQRQVPVIYTVRKDHFDPRPDDGPGNFRVHFDLQMRNIISWRDGRDQQFVRRLTKRVEFVTRPTLRQREDESRKRREEHQFQILPLRTRLFAVFVVFRRALKRLGYKGVVMDEKGMPWAGRQPQRNTMSLSLLWVQSSFSIKEIKACWQETFKVLRSRFEIPEDEDQIRRWQYLTDNHYHYRAPNRIEIKNVKQLAIRLVLCSLNKTPRGRIETALPVLHGDQTGCLFGSNTESFINQRIGSLPTNVSVHVLDGIRSEKDAVTKAESLR